MARFALFAMASLLLALPAATSARTWYITPDGTGDAPTIQAGVDSASAGDTVFVACGHHSNEDIICTRLTTLLGESSACSVIDGEAGSQFDDRRHGSRSCLVSAIQAVPGIHQRSRSYDMDDPAE